MIVFPNCKINLGLRILNKREDGFHNIETVFYPIPFTDALEIITSHSPKEVTYSSSGNSLEVKEEDNLCIKAFRLLKKDFPSLPNIQLHLHKAIPTGAGLGGGSADAAFTLILLNEKFKLNITTEGLLHYAAQLGSDCPFFILRKPCYATGRGELLNQMELNLSIYTFVLINSGIHINTGWAFSKIVPSIGSKSIKEIIQQPIDTWRKELVNDFENPVFENYPEIKKIKEELYNQGALYASMTGSGSTVYGIFKKDSQSQFSFPPHYLIKHF